MLKPLSVSLETGKEAQTMARGKRSRAREEASEEEEAAPDVAKETEKPDAEGNGEGEDRAEVEEREDKSAGELLLPQCKAILKLLMEQKHAWLFNEPVDPVKLDIPDYPSVIKHPMDLGTIKGRLDKKAYRDLSLEFAKDVRLTFENAMTYNPPGHEVHVFAKKLLALFEKEWKASNKGVAMVAPPPKIRQQTTSVRALSFEEKQNLLENLLTLPPHMQHSAVMLMREKSPHIDWSSEEVDVQLDLMDNQMVQELDEYVRKCMKSVAPSEKRVKKTMGSNKARSKGKQRKGNDKAEEEEEDIGIVIDVPLSLFPAQKAK